MCKKVKYSSVAVLMLVLLLTGPADAELVGYWPFDEASGDVANDVSGNGNNGTINAAEWGDGRYGPALSFNAVDSYVEVPSSPNLEIDGPVTIAAWIKWIDSGDGWQTVLSKGPYGGPGENYAVFVNLGGRYFHFALAADGGRVTHNSPGNSVRVNEWLHVCCTADGSVARIYIDGLVVLEVPQTGGLVPTTQTLRIGHREGSPHYWNGMIDEVRIYNHALTQPEVLAAMEGAVGYPYAIGANPQDGAVLATTWTNLSWTPGSFAVSHNLYLGDNFDDVNNGTGDTFRGALTDPSMLVGFVGYPYPDGLAPGTTYYWRVDEVNDADPDSPWKGDVWSFWIPPTNAYEPSPSDGESYVLTDSKLDWTAGFEAKLHFVYFGDNFDDVNNATVAAPTPSTTFTPPALEPGKTYYWRVDESNPPNPTAKGDVWSFTTMPDIPVAEPNLIGWWKLDEAAIAVDWSGHGNHGALVGGLQSELGYDGRALAFDGRDDFVSVPLDVSETAYAAVLWFKTTNPNCGVMAVVNTDLGNAHDRHVYLTDGDIGIRLWDNEIIQTNGLNLANGLWHHLVYTYGAGIGGQRVYVDGVLRASGSKTSSDFNWQQRVNLGFSHDGTSTYFEGVMDDVRIYDKSLTQEEARELMRGDPALAGLPDPANGAMADIFAATNLSWLPGENAAQHDVYFGIDEAAVEAADTSDTTGVYRGRQSLTSYAPSEGIQMSSGPYYWRIDEYNTDGTISQGKLWSFTVGDYALVDDFESYNDIESGQPGSNLVYETWSDGYGIAANGSTMGYTVAFQPTMETTIVHGGRQSAPMEYNNTAAALSEVTRTLAGQDWTAHNLQTLSIWFYGNPANVAGQLYVKVNDIQVMYDGDARNLTLAGWQPWNIDLASFGGGLQNVTKIAIGVQGPGATGTLLLDDIRLYAAPRQLITPVQPTNNDLLAHYPFDGDFRDVSGSGLHGMAVGLPTFTNDPMRGQVLSLNGTSALDLGAGDAFNFPGSFSISTWAKIGAFVDNWGHVIIGKRGESGVGWQLRRHGGNPNLTFTLRGTTGADDPRGGIDMTSSFDQWVHIAAVYDVEAGTRTVYVNGIVDVSISDSGSVIGATHNTYIGARANGANDGQEGFMTGSLDELRVYNRALSIEEIAGLSGRIQPFDAPL